MITKAEKALWIVKGMEDDAEVAYDRDPAGSYRLDAKAHAARQEWKIAYPEAAAELAEQARVDREQRAAERAERLAHSWVARNLD